MSDLEVSNDELGIDEHNHSKLINALRKFDKIQHIQKPSRDEPALESSEFSLIKTDSSNYVDVNNLAQVLSKTASHVEIGKKLQKTQNIVKTLSKPLEKTQAEKIKRSAGFDETKKHLSRWDAVVARNRTVDYISFPLKAPVNKMQPTKDYLAKLKLKSNLEKELEIITPVLEVNKEPDDNAFPMSLEEMLEHRKETARLRAQESFKAAKAKRQSKIKSKKYHRIMKKEKLKQQIKEFEILQKSDPEEALRKLEELEKARAEERHTLRHKNTGKWAKSKLVRAKYDKEMRQQLSEQLAMSRNLTKKIQDNDSDDDMEDNHDIVDSNITVDPSNPWVNKGPIATKEVTDFLTGYRKYWQDRNLNTEIIKSQAADDFNDKTVEEPKKESNLTHLSKFKTDKKLEKKNDTLENNICSVNESEDIINKNVKSTSEWQVDMIREIIKPGYHKENSKKEVTELFDSLENNLQNEVSYRILKLQEEYNELSKPRKGKEDINRIEESDDELSKLEFKNLKKPQSNAPLLETSDRKNSKEQNFPDALPDIKASNIPNGVDHNTENIDPEKFFKAQPKYMLGSATNDDTGYDNLDDEEENEHRKNIEEVFEEDDVVAGFRQEKQDEIDKDKPMDINLSLPGWGTWGGKNIKVSKRKKQRFIINMPKKLPRRDDNKGDVIIKEFRNDKVKAHKVSELPFPFETVKDYEASIRAPLGNTFIPESAHKKLIKPNIFTKAGTVIEAMDDEELLTKRGKSMRGEKK